MLGATKQRMAVTDDVVLRAVAYTWLLCRFGVGRERYYFGCALGASGLCFAQQVRRLGCAALLWMSFPVLTMLGGGLCPHTERTVSCSLLTCRQMLQPSCPGDMNTVWRR